MAFDVLHWEGKISPFSCAYVCRCYRMPDSVTSATDVHLFLFCFVNCFLSHSPVSFSSVNTIGSALRALRLDTSLGKVLFCNRCRCIAAYVTESGISKIYLGLIIIRVYIAYDGRSCEESFGFPEPSLAVYVVSTNPIYVNSFNK